MLQLVLTLVIYLILVIPVGRYLYHIAAGKHTFADPVFDRIDGLIYKAGGVDPAQGYELEAVRAGPARRQRRDDRHWLSDPADPEHWDLQPQSYRRHGAVAGLQHHHQLHDQYELTALLR